jgi:hypothetical protein
MKQKILLMKLAFKLAGMFMWDFYKILRMEIADKTLYPQENYSSCLERATAMVMDAMKRPLAFFALAIANHRLCSHGDNNVTEVKELSEGLSVKDSKAALKVFWMM